MPNLRSKKFSEFFHLQSIVDSEFFRGGVWAPTFFGHTKFEVKHFSKFFDLHSAVDYEFFRWGVGQIFLVMLNLGSKNFSEFFHLQSALYS